MKFAELIGGSYHGRALCADAERTANFFVESIESPTGQTKTSRVLMPRPGLKPFSTIQIPSISLTSKTVQSATLTVVTAHTAGTPAANALFTCNLALGANPPLFMSQFAFFDPSTYTQRSNTSTWLGSASVHPHSQWSYATDNGWRDTAYQYPWETVVSLWQHQSVTNTASPADKLFVYDCYIDIVFTDGATARLRPTQATIVPGETSVTNPRNAINGDLTNSAEIDRAAYGTSDIVATLQLSGFAVWYDNGVPQVTGFPVVQVRSAIALAESNDRLFGIGQSAGARNAFFEVHRDGTYTVYDDRLPGDARPQMSLSQNQVLVLSGGFGYVFDLKANTLTQITDPDFPTGAIKCDQMDGYFLVLEPKSQKFAISAINDGLTWDALDFADVEGEPGNVNTFIVDHRQIWFLAENHGEIFYDSGNADFPFTRLQGAFFEQGSNAIDSVAKIDNSIMWLGRNKDGANIVWRANGYTPQRVSTHAIEQMIDAFGDTTNARGYSYQEGGHTFYRLDFPSANEGRGATLVYDAGEQEWHERFYWDATLGVERADLARCHAFVWGRHIVGDYRSGQLYIQSQDYATDAGSVIRRIRSAPDLVNGGQEVFYSELRLLMSVGIGLDGGVIPGSDPKLLLQISDDGGYTWGRERAVSMGKIGDFARLVRFLRLGSSRNRAFRLICAEPVSPIIAAADLDAQAGY